MPPHFGGSILGTPPRVIFRHFKVLKRTFWFDVSKISRKMHFGAEYETIRIVGTIFKVILYYPGSRRTTDFSNEPIEWLTDNKTSEALKKRFLTDMFEDHVYEYYPRPSLRHRILFSIILLRRAHNRNKNGRTLPSHRFPKTFSKRTCQTAKC